MTRTSPCSSATCSRWPSTSCRRCPSPPPWWAAWSSTPVLDARPDRGRTAASMEPVTQRPVPPRADCPDVEDCVADPSEIGRVCVYGPICGTCAVYRVIETDRGLLLGTCRIRTDRGEFPCTAPICESYVPRAGALDAKGRPTQSGESTVVQIARAQKTQAARARREQPAPAPRPKVPDGPVGVVEMNREELKS